MQQRTFLGAVLLLSLCPFITTDTIVQLNVNRPYNDVNENFVSFSMRPEELYEALDGANRKSVTRMAAMLGNAYVKFTGDYYFATSSRRKLRNPTKIIWKGFNRWTRAVNWTMIIPVPYTPKEWDSMYTLKILNTSYVVGITDCIWQLGTDFGTSRAKDYVSELNTLKLMVDTFKPFVDDWRIMGADISAGSSAEETRRYVEMSKDLNAAFGWTQSKNMLPVSSLGSYIYENDPALRTLLSQRVPVWLNLPQEDESSSQKIQKRLVGDEITDALRWAQTLGDAASGGFDVIFKHMTVSDWELPNYSFYVTALFKKVMGSRVFPARPLNIFSPTNKLYTHCANTVSGGIAFMVVNTEEQPLTILVRSFNKLPGAEFWQYTLTSERGRVYLNNIKLPLNATLKPQIKTKNPDTPLQLITPGMSVSFWVLPEVSLEHCQFTEIEADDKSSESTEKRVKSRAYSSADKLLQKLIEQTSVSRSPLQSAFNRNRRFVLEDENQPKSIFSKLLQPFQLGNIVSGLSLPQKREATVSAVQPVRRRAALAWLRQVLEQTKDITGRGGGLLKRSIRNADNSYYYNKKGKRIAFTKKITDIRKPEKNTKPLFDSNEFDEEEYFRKIDERSEPEYTRLPEGDVHLKLIDQIDGEDEEMEVNPMPNKPTVKKALKIVQRSEEQPENEEKPTGLLPSEFFEALPGGILKPSKRINIGAALNSLLFPEPFSKKATKMKGVTPKALKATVSNDDVDSVDKANVGNIGATQLAEEFLLAQKQLGKSFLEHISKKRTKPTQALAETEGEAELETASSLELTTKLTTAKPTTAAVTTATATVKKMPKTKPAKYINEKIGSLFAENEDEQEEGDNVDSGAGSGITPSVEYDGEGALEESKLEKSEEERLKKKRKQKNNKNVSKNWWSEITALRSKRALKYDISVESIRSNMIDKDDEFTPLGHVVPEHITIYEQTKPTDATKITETTEMSNMSTTAAAKEAKIAATKAKTAKPVTASEKSGSKLKQDENFTSKLMATVKSKVNRFMHIITRHVNEWYNTLTKPSTEVALVGPTTNNSNIIK